MRLHLTCSDIAHRLAREGIATGELRHLNCEPNARFNLDAPREALTSNAIRRPAAASASSRASSRYREIGTLPGHAFNGQTQRNRSLFLERGHAYVYLIYGISFLLNVSSEALGVGGGVLLRAIEPLEGIDQMMAGSGGTTRLADLGRGPGRLTKALRVDLAQDGLDLCAAGPLWLAITAQSAGTIGKSVRVGITRDVDRLLRFYERGNAHVSGARKLRPLYRCGD